MAPLGERRGAAVKIPGLPQPARERRGLSLPVKRPIFIGLPRHRINLSLHRRRIAFDQGKPIKIAASGRGGDLLFDRPLDHRLRFVEPVQ